MRFVFANIVPRTDTESLFAYSSERLTRAAVCSFPSEYIKICIDIVLIDRSGRRPFEMLTLQHRSAKVDEINVNDLFGR